VSEWEQCDVSCGGGTQYRNVTCRNKNGHYDDDEGGCAAHKGDELIYYARPSDRRVCNTASCTPPPPPPPELENCPPDFHVDQARCTDEWSAQEFYDVCLPRPTGEGTFWARFSCKSVSTGLPTSDGSPDNICLVSGSLGTVWCGPEEVW